MIKNLFYKDLLDFLMKQYKQRFPNILSEIQLVLIKFQNLMNQLIFELKFLQKQNPENKIIQSVVVQCSQILSLYLDKNYSYIIKSNLQTILDLSNDLQYIRVSIHSMEHCENNKKQIIKSYKKIQRILNDLETIPTNLKESIDQNHIIFSYIQYKINHFQIKIKKLSKLVLIIDKINQNDSYYMCFNNLFNKKKEDKKINKIFQQLKERNFLIAKLQILLEQPQHLIFQIKNFELQQLDNLNKIEQKFLNNLENENFIYTKLNSTNTQKFINFIRKLYEISSKESLEEYFEIPFNESVFLENLINLQKINFLLKTNTQEYEKEINNFQSQNHTDHVCLNSQKDQILCQTLKILQFQNFNSKFDQFRKRSQKFFLEEFGEIINIYY